MSFLPGRLAAAEGSYFLNESKHAAGRLAEKLPSSPASASASPSPHSDVAPADVLPEILRHSIPIKRASSGSDASLSTASKWVLNGSGSANSVSADAINPLRAYVSLPQVTFGPKSRWQLPSEQTHFSASTANDLRRGQVSSSPDPEKLKALMHSYSQIGKAFAVATIVVFGGVTALSVYTAHKLELRTTDDIRTKGRDAIQPRVDKLKEQMSPFRSWVENMSRRWHVEEGNKEAKENPLIKELSKAIGVKTSN
ncbi:hypothetical protein FCM35_KLT06190 [Carex littledalei]|uniref:Uncharacterized protein n=1 Tax=Carex littledalei TaxID=544730 RepID=A0A833V8V1_9POAL|nr:hypothetical protein FCM35_KLT06190 [Carex littledalei]